MFPIFLNTSDKYCSERSIKFSMIFFVLTIPTENALIEFENSLICLLFSFNWTAVFPTKFRVCFIIVLNSPCTKSLKSLIDFEISF